MASNLGVTFIERDQSKSVSALEAPAGAISVYSEKGPTDKAILTRSEDDIRRIFGQPLESFDLGGGITDLNRGLHNAFKFVRAGLPMFINRVIPTGTLAVKATSDISSDASGDDVRLTALGHGDEFYNGLSVVIAGIEIVTRSITIAAGATEDLIDNVLPKTFQADDGTNFVDDGTSLISDATKVLISGAVDIDLTYEDNANFSGSSSLKNNSGSPITINISYERTTQDRVVRLFIVNDGENDPKNNFIETFLVSYKTNGKDEAGNNIFIDDKVNGVSELFESKFFGDYDQTTLALGTKRPTPSDQTSYSTDATPFASGTDGVYQALDADVSTAYSEFLNRTRYDILLVFDAGYADAVKARIASVCRKRLFPHGYIDPDITFFVEGTNTLRSGLGVSILDQQVVNELIDWRQTLPFETALDSEFVSVAGSTWGVTTDEFNGSRNLFMPPSFETGANAIVVHNTLGPFKSVMGPRRGVTGFNSLAINLFELRNSLNAKQVNPLIIDERGVQMFFGNKTLKTVASAMQQSHARITRGHISRRFFFSASDFIAEDIIDSTFNDIRDEFEEILESFAAGLESFSLVVGPPKTTVSDINNQILRIGVGLIFNQIAEEIIIETTVFRNGTDLSVEVL